MSKILNEDIWLTVGLLTVDGSNPLLCSLSGRQLTTVNRQPAFSLLTRYSCHQAAELGAEELQCRLVAHAVLGERSLLELRVDGIAVE